MTGRCRFIVFGLLAGLLALFLAGTVTVADGYAHGRKNIMRAQHVFQKTPARKQDHSVRPRDRREKFLKKKFRHNTARKALESGRIVSLSVIRGRIRQSFPGKIVDVRLLEPRGDNRPYIYVVKLLRKDGRLLLLRVNAANARIISVRGNN